MSADMIYNMSIRLNYLMGEDRTTDENVELDSITTWLIEHAPDEISKMKPAEAIELWRCLMVLGAAKTAEKLVIAYQPRTDMDERISLPMSHRWINPDWFDSLQVRLCSRMSIDVLVEEPRMQTVGLEARVALLEECVTRYLQILQSDLRELRYIGYDVVRKEIERLLRRFPEDDRFRDLARRFSICTGDPWMTFIAMMRYSGIIPDMVDQPQLIDLFRQATRSDEYYIPNDLLKQLDGLESFPDPLFSIMVTCREILGILKPHQFKVVAERLPPRTILELLSDLNTECLKVLLLAEWATLLSQADIDRDNIYWMIAKKDMLFSLDVVRKTFNPDNCQPQQRYAIIRNLSLLVRNLPPDELGRYLEVCSPTNRLQTISVLRCRTIPYSEQRRVDSYVTETVKWAISCSHAVSCKSLAAIAIYVLDGIVDKRQFLALVTNAKRQLYDISPIREQLRDNYERDGWVTGFVTEFCLYTPSLVQGDVEKDIEWSPQEAFPYKIFEQPLLRSNITISNGGGLDRGGPSREFWEVAVGGMLKQEHLVSSQDNGWLLPARLESCKLIGYVIFKIVYIDRIPICLDLHPALLCAISWQWLLEDTLKQPHPWAVVKVMLGEEWARELAPAFWWSQPANEDEAWAPDSSRGFILEYRERYSEILPMLRCVREACSTLNCSPRLLDHLIAGERPSGSIIEILESRLSVTNRLPYDQYSDGVVPAVRCHYKDCFMAVVKRLSRDELQELYRFWFATTRPNFSSEDSREYACIQVVAASPQTGGAIVSHTCTSTLDIPLSTSFGVLGQEDVDLVRDGLVDELYQRIKEALENQRRWESTGILYQIS
jgi:hypothetical protein